MTHHAIRLHAHRHATVRTRQHQGFHAKPVYRPPLIAYGIYLLMWFAIWVGIWAVLP